MTDNPSGVDQFQEYALRVLARQISGRDEEPPTQTGNVVPQEGRQIPNPPGISPRQYAVDFLQRVTGQIPAAAEQLPEQDYRP